MACVIADIDTKAPVNLSQLENTDITWQTKTSSSLTDEERQTIKKLDMDTYKKDNNDYIFGTYPCSYLLLCKGSQVIGGMMYWVTDYGKKISRSFSSNPKTYGRLILLKKKELFAKSGWYGEQSGAVAHMLITHQALSIQPVKDKDVVRKVIGDDVVFADDFEQSGKYTRYIAAIKSYEEKMLFGRPCMKGKKVSDCEFECDEMSGGAKVYVVLKGEKRQRKVRVDSNKKKYIMVNKKKVLLSSIKGKYKYT